MEGNNNGRRPSQKPSVGTSFERSVENLSIAGRRTLVIVNQNKRREPMNTRENSFSVVFDRMSPQFEWLHIGWIVEERRMLSDPRRLYRYYYDPAVNMYSRKHIVEAILDD